MNTQITQYPMASLYVGDLHPEVTEAMLYEKFSTAAGPVLSIRVCRDLMSRKSLGYAYVNFQNPADAERALDTMNFDEMKGRPIRIMWSQRDPSLRRSGVGNVFIKNLDKQIDQKSLYDTFAAFGNILSCKIATDEHSHSKGYGFVHFETQEAANQAIAKVNGMLLNNKKVYVGPFVPRKDRAQTAGDPKFTNCFVKNFGDDLTDESLRTLFENYGEVTSAKVMIDENSKKSKGFGFVCFKNADAAAAAVKTLNEHEVAPGRRIYVGRAQKKSERTMELKVKFERLKMERMNKYQQGVNLYVKNLDDSIDDTRLKEEFDKYGDITSAKVMTDANGRSKGFGFVCFSKPDEATRAVTDMNGKLVVAKPLYVALAQRKEDRKAHLHNQYMQRIQQFRLQQGQFPGQIYGPGSYLVPTMGPQRFFQPTGPIALRQNTPRWQGPPANVMTLQQASAMPARHQIPGGGPGQARPGMQHAAMMNQSQVRSGQSARPITGAMPHVLPNQVQRPMGMPGNIPPTRANQQPPMQMTKKGPAGPEVPGAPAHPQAGHGGEVINLPNQAPLTTSELANAPPREQKQMLGERLYPLVHEMYPQHCGKITGMLLEIDNSELLHMLESNESLKAKVDEAYQVLQAHQSKVSQPGPQQAMAAAGDS